MVNVDTRKLLRSLAKLIEKPEIKALQVSLVQTLEQLVEAESISLFEIRTLKQVGSDQAEDFLVPVGIDDSFEEDDAPLILLREEPQFMECCRSQNLVIAPRSAADGAGAPLRFIHPIFGMKGVTGFLVIDAAEHIERDQEMAAIFLGFIRNYILLLNDNQRDHLTGLLNRKCFDDKVMKMILTLGSINKRDADKVCYCLAVLDIDHFKRVNDTYGHLMGDEVLLHFSQCMNETFREYDLLFRVGGEEFVVVLRNVDAERAQTVMERFRKVVETHYFPQVGQVTASIGVTFIGPHDLPGMVMDRADQALYFVKEHGRNQVAFYEQLVAQGKLLPKQVESDIELF
ncbi:GGDEF domain-containing protein [Noviherbaspirillum sedimenti]|nr:GGDEF domain-containing protein [Noviherbaspirillum sedimenti]